LKLGNDGATFPHPASESNLIDSSPNPYEVVEGDLNDLFPTATGEASYNALDKRGRNKPGVYDRLKGPRQSTQGTKLRATKDEEEVEMSTVAF